MYYRVPEAVYSDNQDMLGEVFVDTVDTVSAENKCGHLK